MTIYLSLYFNYDVEVMVTNIWFCTDIISTLVNKLNKGHYPFITPPHTQNLCQSSHRGDRRKLKGSTFKM